MQLIVFLLAGIYGLPDAGQIPEPDAAQQARIDKDLAALRRGEGEDVAAAVRDLALLGEVVLPAVVRRLNEAAAGERLMLLGAVQRMPRAARLLDQARADPHAAVRAWAKGPPPRQPADLRLLARRYLEVLAVAERKLRREANEDFEDLGVLKVRRLDRYRFLHERMKDRRLADEVQQRRNRIANRFAVEGGRALREGRLPPELEHPVFAAYVGLLREEGIAFYNTVTALVAAGERAAPALERLLERSNHDARKIVRVLAAVRGDGGRGVYDRFDAFPEEAQRALVVVAPGILPAAGLPGFLERAALGRHDTVRTAALDGLLALPAPAGRDVARRLLDPSEFGPAEFKRAAGLLARGGDLELLEQYATVALPPDDGSERANQLRLARHDARYALTSSGNPATEALGRKLAASGDPATADLGIRLVSDQAELLRLARELAARPLARTAALRALKLHGDARAVLAAMRARGLALPMVQELARAPDEELFVEMARAEETREVGRRALASLARIDPRHEPALLAMYDALPEDAPREVRRRALEALLPAGTPEVVRRFEAAGALAVDVLVARAESGLPIPFAMNLSGFLAEAGPDRLEMLGTIADALPELEPGFLAALLDAWDALPAGGKQGDDPEGPLQQKVKLLDVLARSGDKASAARLFARLVSGELKEVALLLGTLKAAARLVPAADLAVLLPVLREAVRNEYALEDRLAPPEDLWRSELLRGGMYALAYARTPQGEDLLCDILLDPGLYSPAYDWEYESWAPWWALNALRLYPRDRVEPALRRALARADADGRLARLHPQRLYQVVRQCRRGRRTGRWLGEVGAALCEVLERVGWQDDVAYRHMLNLGAQKRYADAARVARRGAARKRTRGFEAADGFWTADRIEGRAVLYEALVAGTPEAFAGAIERLGDDPLLLNTAAWYLNFYVPDAVQAARAAREAVRGTAGLYHPYRDTLAAVRLTQRRPDEALVLLDPARRLPVKREVTSGWFEVFVAKAHLQRGERLSARHALENALANDRRLLPTLRADPELKEFSAVFDAAEEELFDDLFATR